MGVERFEIELEVTPLVVYSPGQTLRGNIIVVNSTEIEFKGRIAIRTTSHIFEKTYLFHFSQKLRWILKVWLASVGLK